MPVEEADRNRARYSRLQLCDPDEDFHFSDQARFQAHRSFTWFRMTFAVLALASLMPC
jgi:hypothetical protein